jgi:hypothetical protein
MNYVHHAHISHRHHTDLHAKKFAFLSKGAFCPKSITAQFFAPCSTGWQCTSHLRYASLLPTLNDIIIIIIIINVKDHTIARDIGVQS